MTNETEKKTVEANPIVVAREVALDEFNRWAVAWDIHTELKTMTQEDRDSYESQRDAVVAGIMLGNATVSADGETITYRLKKPTASVSELTFAVPTGAAYMAMDAQKEGRNIAKMFEFMGAMSKQPGAMFSKLDGRDLKFCQGVVALFLGS